MGRELDEVALQRGPDGLRSTSSRDCGHLILLADIGAAGGDTAGREPENWNRSGRVGPDGPATRSGLRPETQPKSVRRCWSYKTRCRTANLDEPTRSYGTRIARWSSLLEWRDQERPHCAEGDARRCPWTRPRWTGNELAAGRQPPEAPPGGLPRTPACTGPRPGRPGPTGPERAGPARKPAAIRPSKGPADAGSRPKLHGKVPCAEFEPLAGMLRQSVSNFERMIPTRTLAASAATDRTFTASHESCGRRANRPTTRVGPQGSRRPPAAHGRPAKTKSQ